MKIKPTGNNIAFLKRQARNIKKQTGISHTNALNLIAKEHGYSDWDTLVKNNAFKVKPKRVLRRPKVPVPEVSNYHNFINGKITGQHPNAKMTIRRHALVGNLLQILLEATEYYKRANNHIEEIRVTMDNWLGCEYSEEQLANAEFNEIYYGKTLVISSESKPSNTRLAELKRFLRKAKETIDRSYHDCAPILKLHKRFDQAAKALETWPVNISLSNRSRRKLPVGKFVRLGRSQKIGVVFYHDTYRDTIEGYSDGGRFVRGRSEVRVLRKQLSINDFKPMRLHLPYGKWICEDGREVLFNRDYCPIWEKSAHGVVGLIEPGTYVEHTQTDFYFDDSNAPYYNNNITVNRCLSVLDEWGVKENNSKILDMVPIALESGDFNLLNPKRMS